jgi:hypothetical protein
MLRRDLIANVSHDLKTPLTIIKSYAEMIIDISGDNKGKREEHLGVIIKESDRLTELVNDILDLSKIEAKIEKFEMKEFDIADTLRRVYEKFQVFSECKKINFNLICPDSLMAIGNEVRINQVMYNLIGNAVNYTGPDNFVEVKLFEKEETVHNILLNGDGYIVGEAEGLMLDHTKVLPLSYEPFARMDTIIFKDLTSKQVAVRHKEKGHGIVMEFSGFPMMAFWTKGKEEAPVICVEPWHGCAAFEQESGKFEDKAACLFLDAGESIELSYRVHRIL